MKKLFVRPKFRGLKIGRKLAAGVIEESRKIDYSCMHVHTLRTMEAANTLYESLGFREIDPYEENVIEGGVFMELLLV